MWLAKGYVQVLVATLSCAADGAAATSCQGPQDFAWMLPPGWVYPRVEQPAAPVPAGDAAVARSPLSVETKDYACHRLNLDPTAGCGAWADRLLLIEVGMPQPWSPGTNYAIYPEGLQGQGNYLIVWLARQMLMFEKRLDAAFNTVLRSVNVPEYELRRDGEFLLLGHRDGRRWYFESVGTGGSAWRLTRIVDARFATRATTVEYDDAGKVVDIALPNGRSVKLAYENDLPRAVLLPSGERIALQQDSNGFIAALRYYPPEAPGSGEGPTGRAAAGDARQPAATGVPGPPAKRGAVAAARGRQPAAPPKPELPGWAKVSGKPVREYLYEHDSGGRLLRFTDCDGCEYRVEYASDGSKGIEKGTVTIHDVAAQTYEFRRYTIRGAEVLVEKGAGREDQALKDATPQSRLLMRKLGSSYQIVERSDFTTGGTWRTTFDAKGRPTATRGRGMETLCEYNAAGQLIRRANGSGGSQQHGYDDAGRVVSTVTDGGIETFQTWDEAGRLLRRSESDGLELEYRYTPEDGDLCEVVVNGAVHRLRTDALARLVEHVRPDGSRLTWRYDAAGMLVSETLVPAPVQGDSIIPSHWDPRDGDSARLTGGGEVRWTGLLGSDAAVRASSATTQLPDAETIIHGAFWGPRLVLVPPDADPGRLAALAVAVSGSDDTQAITARYEYDVWHRLRRIRYGDGSSDRFEYDGLRLVHVSTRTGEETRYSYDANGRMTERRTDGKRTAQWQYDAAGRITMRGALQSDGTWRTVRRLIDQQGRCTATVDDAGKATSYVVNDDGRIVRILCPDGTDTSYTFDKTGRTIRVSGSHERYGEREMEYDNRGQLALERRVREKTGGGTEVVETRYEHDGRGRQTGTISATGEFSRTTYDARGLRIGCDNARSSAQWFYDGDGRLLEVRESPRPFQMDRSRVVERRVYDRLGRLAGVYTGGFAEDGRPQLRLARAVAYDAAGFEVRLGTAAVPARARAAPAVPDRRYAAVPDVKIAATEDTASLAELRRGLVLFHSPGCPECNWARQEWLPEFSAHLPGLPVHLVDVQKESGLKLLLALEHELGTTKGDLPAVYHKGHLYYGMGEISGIEP